MDLYRTIDEIAESGRAVVMATLVSTHGTSPKPIGTKMFVRAGDGKEIVGSVTIGGCVDARVIAEARSMGPENRRKSVSVELADDEAAEMGLICGGIVQVLLEYLLTGHPAFHTYRRIHENLQKGIRTLRCVDVTGDNPELVLTPGALDGDEQGHELVAELKQVFDRGSSASFEVCGSQIFAELHVPRPLLVVVGANDVGVELSRLGVLQGYNVVVVDSRPTFATPIRFPGADVRVGIPSEEVAMVRLSPTTSLAIVVHDHKFEVPILERVLGTDCGYVGLLGGTKRTAGVKNLLLERGVSADSIARVKTPIGLDIGALTSSEIALSILAEVLANRRGKELGKGRAAL